jgi:hypothetical protein
MDSKIFLANALKMLLKLFPTANNFPTHQTQPNADLSFCTLPVPIAQV